MVMEVLPRRSALVRSTASRRSTGQVLTANVNLAATCRFTRCEHRTEPGCAVLAATEDGTLPERRLASYRKLQRESHWLRSREDARLAADQRAQWKRVHKEQRQLYADRERHGRHR